MYSLSRAFCLICIFSLCACSDRKRPRPELPYILSQDRPFFKKIKGIPDDDGLFPLPPLPTAYAEFNLIIDDHGNVYGHIQEMIPVLCGYAYDGYEQDFAEPMRSRHLVRIDTAALTGNLSTFLQSGDTSGGSRFVMVALPMDTVWHQSLIHVADFLNARKNKFIYFLRRTTREEDSLIHVLR